MNSIESPGVFLTCRNLENCENVESGKRECRLYRGNTNIESCKTLVVPNCRHPAHRRQHIACGSLLLPRQWAATTTVTPAASTWGENVFIVDNETKGTFMFASHTPNGANSEGLIFTVSIILREFIFPMRPLSLLCFQ